MGCALVSRGKTLDVHWYTPERVHPQAGAAEMQATCELRLASVTSGADLGPRITFGDGLYRVGEYEDRRWTERPEHYVRRALGRKLFEEGSFRRVLTGRATTLDVELLDFEEVKTPTVHEARVAVRVVLASDQVLAERTLVITSPVKGNSFEDFVATMSAALDKTADEVARVAHVACGPAPVTTRGRR
jgi:cholesterol transport system auxiliary component